ncbi:MAG: flagellar hook assembly protein FlgD [Sphingomonas sp.]|uniref:flagellar hook assembly protein FlgD n=1 Tax=Sphingomonas sp. TaxID=28214 RepID=UPI0025E8D010|nr:flagellar hook assembly protein FlgD [Sphingomonas sp.]MBX3562976.1 flagellar hook assembly protein FlgD [Sphingomonas sp.]
MATSFDSTLANLGISRTGAATAAKDTAKLGNANMDQGDFLRLMTAQLKNQDPFSPVDNSQMVAQMAQFSSLAGISEMNTTLKAISDRLNGTSPGDAMSWIGRTVLTAGNTAYPRIDGSVGGTIDLAADAANVTVTIEGPNGALLRTVDLGAQSKGAIDFEWDGTTDTGEAAGPGPYTIRVGARNAAGTAVSATPLVWAPVTSVTLGSDGSPVLTLPGLGQVPVSAVRKIG